MVLNRVSRKKSSSGYYGSYEGYHSDPNKKANRAQEARGRGLRAGEGAVRRDVRAERGARSLDEPLTQRARAAREAGDGLRFAGAAVDRDAVAAWSPCGELGSMPPAARESACWMEARAVVEAMEAAS